MIEPKLDTQARAVFSDYLRGQRRALVDLMLAEMQPGIDQPSFASSAFFAAFLDRLIQTLERDSFLPLQLWVKVLACSAKFETDSSRLLTIACATVTDAFRSDFPGYSAVTTYMTLTAVDVEATFSSVRLGLARKPVREIAENADLSDVIALVGSMLRAHDEETHRHAQAVSALSARLAAALQYARPQRVTVERCGFLFAIGKLVVAPSILQKPAALGNDEWAQVKRYPAAGAEILSTIPALAECAAIVATHREQPDGLGYPAGLSGSQIPPQAKIVAVADAFHAMTSPRPYRAALSVPEALACVQQGAGTRFDAEVVGALLELVQPSVRVHEASHQQMS